MTIFIHQQIHEMHQGICSILICDSFGPKLTEISYLSSFDGNQRNYVKSGTLSISIQLYDAVSPFYFVVVWRLSNRWYMCSIATCLLPCLCYGGDIQEIILYYIRKLPDPFAIAIWHLTVKFINPRNFFRMVIISSKLSLGRCSFNRLTNTCQI